MLANQKVDQEIGGKARLTTGDDHAPEEDDQGEQKCPTGRWRTPGHGKLKIIVNQRPSISDRMVLDINGRPAFRGGDHCQQPEATRGQAGLSWGTAAPEASRHEFDIQAKKHPANRVPTPL